MTGFSGGLKNLGGQHVRGMRTTSPVITRMAQSALPTGLMLAVPLAMFFGLDMPFTRENLALGMGLASIPAFLYTFRLSRPLQPHVSVASKIDERVSACQWSSRGDRHPGNAEGLDIPGIARQALSTRSERWKLSSDVLDTAGLRGDPEQIFAIISQVMNFMDRAAPDATCTVELLRPRVDSRAHPDLMLLHMRFNLDGVFVNPTMRQSLVEFLRSGKHADQFPELAIARSFMSQSSGQIGCEHFESGTRMWVSIALPRVVREEYPAIRNDHRTEFGNHLRRLVFPNASGAALLSTRLSELAPHGKPLQLAS